MSTKKTPPVEGAKQCFVIMPISDAPDYEPGHFSRVYEHIIKPACDASGYAAIRADDPANTNLIILDILRRIVESSMVVCDLSNRNPNVMYELGVRQAFDLPTVLMKDTRTPRVFDVQGLRTLDYDERLRVDTVATDVRSLSSAITATASSGGGEVNSLIQLLSISKAALPSKQELSGDTSVLLSALEELSKKVSRIEALHGPTSWTDDAWISRSHGKLSSGETVAIGDVLYHDGKVFGDLIGISPKGSLVVRRGGDTYLIMPEHPQFIGITKRPI